MRRKLFFIAILSLFLAGLPGPGLLPAEASGGSFLRIISLAPSITEELYLLGAGDNIVGNTTYCIWPTEAKRKVKIGSIKELDLEKIILLKPDLVLATSLTSPKAIRKLEDLGIKVTILQTPKTFAELCEQFIALGKAVGAQDRARDIVAESREKVLSVTASLAGLARPKVFIEIGAKPLFTANKDYFINDMVKLAGGINIAEYANAGAYSMEEVLRQDVDAILIVTMGIAGEKEREVWRRFSRLSAVKSGRIHVIKSSLICSATPVTFVRALEEIAAFLHPGASGGGR